jgi:dTDP-4-dehydrorhamnose reductase
LLKKKRLLITGGSGLLGSNWACIVRNNYDVYLGVHQRDTKILKTEAVVINFSDYEHALIIIKRLSIQVIVHCAGLANVDECEANIDKAFLANVLISENVSRIANELNIKLVHISTDHLFNGQKSFYEEKDTPSPLNNYGLTKYLAEQKVIKNSKNPLIIRTNFFGVSPFYRDSLYNWIKNSLFTNKKIYLFEDVFFTPIPIDSLVKITHELLDLSVTGIVNVVGNERVSKKEFGLMIASYYNLPSDLIMPSKIKEHELKANRPIDMSLSNLKLRKILGRDIVSLRDGLSIIENVQKKGRQMDLDGGVNE